MRSPTLHTPLPPDIRLMNGVSALLVLGVLLGSALWWLLLCGAVSRLRARFDARWQRRVNRGSALLLAAFALWPLWPLLRR